MWGFVSFALLALPGNVIYSNNKKLGDPSRNPNELVHAVPRLKVLDPGCCCVPKVSPKRSQRLVPRRTPKGIPRARPTGGPKGVPRASPKGDLQSNLQSVVPKVPLEHLLRIIPMTRHPIKHRREIIPHTINSIGLKRP